MKVASRGLVALVSALAASISVALSGTPAGAVEAKAEAERFPLGGSLVLRSSVGSGTWVGEEANQRPYWNLLLSLRPRYTISREHRISVRLRIDLDTNLVENADSDRNRAHQPLWSDLRLSGTWKELLEIEAADLSLSTTAELFFPTSLASRLDTLVLGAGLSLDAAWEPLKWLSVGLSGSFTRSFNRYDTQAIDGGDFDQPPVVRDDGADLDGDLIAVGASTPGWGLAADLSIDFTVVEDLEAGLSFGVSKTLSERAIPRDEYSSRYARGGRGETDAMYAGLEVSWQALSLLALRVGTTVGQAPKSEDNRSVRFPFWDTTNGAANRQVFYLGATLSI